MFERYTEKARQIIFFARQEGSLYGVPVIETEHLLLGLLRVDESLFSRLVSADISIDAFRKSVEDRMNVREKMPTSMSIPLSSATKNALAYAHKEADSLADYGITTEHLLLGLLHKGNSLAAKILGEIGVEYATIRKEVEK